LAYAVQNEKRQDGRYAAVIANDNGRLYAVGFDDQGVLRESHRLIMRRARNWRRSSMTDYAQKCPMKADNPEIIAVAKFIRDDLGVPVIVPATQPKAKRRPPMKGIAAEAVIEEAFAAAREASFRQWLRDGQQDIGACGGYMLNIDARSPVAKLLLEQKRGYRAHKGVGVMYPRHDDIRSQHMEICVQAGRAAKAVFEKYGVRILEARSYID